MDVPVPAGQAPLAASGAVEALIVNKNPANALARPLEGSRRGRVETGTPDGAGDETVTNGGKGLVLPDVSVQGKAGGSPGAAHGTATAEVRNPAPPEPPPPPKFTLVLLPRVQAGVSVAYWPGARTLSAAVEQRFRNRAAYATVLPTPPGYRTLDWVMWFAEAAAAEATARPLMRPPTMVLVAAPAGGPVPLQKKLLAGGVLRKSGHIESLTILNAEAESAAARIYAEAIAESTFTPATHNGEAVDVDVLLEISPTIVRRPLSAGQ
jgi:hypothetical protein